MKSETYEEGQAIKFSEDAAALVSAAVAWYDAAEKTRDRITSEVYESVLAKITVWQEDAARNHVCFERHRDYFQREILSRRNRQVK